MPGTETMDRAQAWQAIDAQRLRLADLLEELSADQWRQQSLCDGWTVRDVAAHLTFAQAQLPAMLAMLARHPGGVQRAGRAWAVRRAATVPAAQLIAQIRAMIGSQRHVFGVTYRATLIDILVHSQDIAVPLGRELAVPPAAAAFAATSVWESGYPFWPRKRLAGFAFAATDAPWSAGSGSEVRGPAEAILLLLTGRNVAVGRLTGAGVPALAARLGASVSASRGEPA